MHYVIFSCMH